MSKGITLIYGTNGSGKTSIALDVAFNAIKEKRQDNKVLYLDHEIGVDYSRIVQILQAKNMEQNIVSKDNGFTINKKLRIEPVSTIEDLINKLKKIERSKPNLLIVDPITAHYLVLICQYSEVGEAISKISSFGRPSKYLIFFSGMIKAYCGKWNMSVLYTTQPVSNVKMAMILKEIEKGGISAYDYRKFVGGKALGHDSKVIVRVIKRLKSERTMILEKHRSKKTGSSCSFKICDCGISDV